MILLRHEYGFYRYDRLPNMVRYLSGLGNAKYDYFAYFLIQDCACANPSFFVPQFSNFFRDRLNHVLAVFGQSWISVDPRKSYRLTKELNFSIVIFKAYVKKIASISSPQTVN